MRSKMIPSMILCILFIVLSPAATMLTPSFAQNSTKTYREVYWKEKNDEISEN